MSAEEKVEEYYKSILDSLGVRHYGKTEKINESIAQALKDADSKSGGSGNNFPDIQLYLEDGYGRGIPVMIEAKGSKGKLVKLDAKTGEVDADTFWTYCLNRETRRVRRVTEGEATEAAAMIELTLGNSVERRKEWLFSGAYNEHLRRDELDL